MDAPLTPLTSPPRRRRGRLVHLDLDSGAHVRKKSFWAGWGGIIVTGFVTGVIVALLVGWVLLWVERDAKLNITLLVLGTVAFTLIIAFVAILMDGLRAQARLRQVEAAFLAGASHNLRTPVSAIRAAAQALEAGGLSAEQRERLVRAIVHETRRLGLRIDNLLETGRLDVERLAFGDEALDLSLMADAVATDHSMGAEARGGHILVTAPEPVAVHGDSRALRLLIENLVDNALKYSDGAPDVRIAVAAHGEHALVHVEDHGIGFDPSAPPRLERFKRGDTGRPGSGLGLPLARAIARGHGGDVFLVSAGPGHGAVAELWLPLARRE